MENSQIHHKGLCIIEPKDQSNGTSELLVTRSLCFVNESIPIRVINITDEDKILYPGTCVATISVASSVKDVQKVSTSDNKLVPEHLKHLFNRTIMDMNTKQRKEVAKLLNKYSDVFPKSDNDTGRTWIIKHQIPTRNTLPIKKQPRRVPAHMTKEY